MDTNLAIALTTLEESSDSSDEEDLIFLCQLQAMERYHLRKRKPRVLNYLDTVNIYSDVDFQSHFRLTRSTFQKVLDYIHEDLIKVHFGNEQALPKIQLMIALWRMANTETYRSIADRFDVGKATAYDSVNRVINALIKRIHVFIHWPSKEQIGPIKNGFQTNSSFPNTIGAIDGTEIRIKCPGTTNKADFINRKSYPSIKLQAVCDHRCLFTSIYVGYPGSTHDQRVFRVSPLDEFLGNEEKFPEDTHLIGDAAYALHPNLMVPFRDNGLLTDRQKNFNFCLSSARMAIERSFGLLKTRWRSILHCVPMDRTENIPKFVAACCILHNICIMNEDQLTKIIAPTQMGLTTTAGYNSLSSYHQEAVAKRNLIATRLPRRDV